MTFRLVALALLASCAHSVELRVGPKALEDASAALRDGRSVRVPTILDDESVTVRPDQSVDIVALTGHRFRVTLADILGDCPLQDREPHRLCQLHDVSYVVVGERKPSKDKWGPGAGGTIVGGVVVSALVGLGVCSGWCDPPYSYVSGAVLIAASIGVLALIMNSGLH